MPSDTAPWFVGALSPRFLALAPRIPPEIYELGRVILPRRSPSTGPGPNPGEQPWPLPKWFPVPPRPRTKTDQDEKAKGRVVRVDDVFAILEKELDEENQLRDSVIALGRSMSPQAIFDQEDNYRVARIKEKIIKVQLSHDRPRLKKKRSGYFRPGARKKRK